MEWNESGISFLYYDGRILVFFENYHGYVWNRLEEFKITLRWGWEYTDRLERSKFIV